MSTSIEKFCSACDESELLSRVELQMNICIECAKKSADLITSMNKTIELLRTEVEKQREKIVVYHNLAERRIQLKKIENQGREAAQRGLPEEENPYLKDSDDWKMWSAGWTDKMFGLSYAGLLLTTREAVKDLRLIQELAVEYSGNQELSDKIETVIQRLSKQKVA